MPKKKLPTRRSQIDSAARSSEETPASPVLIRVGYEWPKQKKNGRSTDPFWDFISKLVQKSVDALNKRLSGRKLQNVACRTSRLRALHGGHVLNVLLERCHSADLLIFDITDFNANVMFELGVGLSGKGLAGKVFIFQKVETGTKRSPEPPSDLSGYFITRYTEVIKNGKSHYSLADRRGFDAALQSRVRDAARSLGYRVDAV
jgi:hypothetical protein